MSDKKKKEKRSPREDKDTKETRVELPPPSPPDGNWQTIDVETLYDKEKCDLNRYEIETVFKILE